MEHAFQQHRLINTVHTLLLLSGMVGVLALIGWLLGGTPFMLWLVVLGVVLMSITPRISPSLILRLYGARPLHPDDVPRLYSLLEELSLRAGLPRVPELHYVASPVANAFTLGRPEAAAVILSDGLLRRLDPRQLAGVLAHEIAHIRHNDLTVMALADMMSRLTSLLSVFGQAFILLSLPVVLFTNMSLPFLAVFSLLLAPTVSALLQLALSRTREFDADLEAARLTGDPAGLAEALLRLERQSLGPLERIFRPHRRNPAPSVLRTHPYTEERVKRLLSLQGEPVTGHWGTPLRLPNHLPPISRRPRRHITGFWY